MRKRLFFVILILTLFTLPGLGCSIISSRGGKGDGGIFASTDYGETWTQKVFVGKEKKKVITISNQGIASIVFDPQDNNTIYLGTASGGIYKTKNSGESWQQTGLKSGSFSQIVINPQDSPVVYTASGSSVFRTKDAGDNWEIIYTDSANLTISALVLDHFNPNIIYAGTSSGLIYKSIDSGENWHTISNLSATVTNLYIYPPDSRVLYALTKGKGIFKSLDGAANWLDISLDLKQYPQSLNFSSFAFSQINANIVYLGTKYGLFKSENAGDNWILQTTLVPFGALPIQGVTTDKEDSNLLFFFVGRHIHKSKDGGKTWKVIENFPSSRNISVLVAKPDISGVLYTGTVLPPK